MKEEITEQDIINFTNDTMLDISLKGNKKATWAEKGSYLYEKGIELKLWDRRTKVVNIYIGEDGKSIYNTIYSGSGKRLHRFKVEKEKLEWRDLN